MEDACHTAPSARITRPPVPSLRHPPLLATLPCHTAPSLLLSTNHHSWLCSLLISPLFRSFFFSHLYSLFLPPHPAPFSNITLACPCHSVICIFPFIATPPLHPLCLLWMDRLFVYHRECSSCPIDQPTGRNLNQR